MKTIAKKTYLNPQLHIVMIQNHQTLLAGSPGASVTGRIPGDPIGDDWDTTTTP